MRLFVKFMVILFALLLFDACQKENLQELAQSEATSPMSQNNGTTKSNSTFERNRNTRTSRPTILGKKRTNPYTVEVMTKAHNKILPNARIERVSTTHLYVKFSPTDFEQLAVLDALDIELFDYPLEYEVIQMGDYYIAEGSTEEDIPTYYAVVPPKFTAPPTVTYEVVEQLHLTEYETQLTSEAFRITNNEYEGNPTRLGVSQDILGTARLCPEEYEDADFPSCLCDELHITGTQEHQDCMDYYNENDPTTTTPSTPVLNDCGCFVSSDARMPGGRVTVEDTQLGPQPVRNVRIVAKDGWFWVDKTYTDDNGCWRINKAYSGNATIKIRFKRDRITVRGMRGARLWQYARAVQDRFTWNGPDFSDICTNFMPNDDDSSPAKMYWYAANANNAAYEYDQYAIDDGIGTPPDDLEILLSNQNTAASAPMLNQMTKNPGFAIVSPYITDQIVWIAIDELVDNFFLRGLSQGETFTPWYQLFKLYILAFAPDVYYGYGGERIAFTTSDRITSIFYHEYGHASHFEALPNQNNYWLSEIKYIVRNGAYGDGLAPDAERAAVVEMWGDFIGVVYANRRYGLNHSLAVDGNNIVTRQRRFIYRAGGGGENHTPVFPIPSDDQDDWIPWGLFMDCTDDTAHNGPPLNINDPVTDNVQGYTIANCFDAVVTGSPITLDEVEQNLINNLPIGQNVADVDLLFQEYGY